MVVLQERAWVQEAVGDMAKRGKFLFETISTRTSNRGSSPGAAVIGSTGLFFAASRPTTKSAGIIPNDPVESLVANCNLAARIDYGSSKLKLQSVEAHAAVAADMRWDSQGAIYNSRKGVITEAELACVPEHDDCSWETDPNGGWLGSFP